MDDQRTDRKRGGIRFRKLRIAWSMGWGVACMLLIALWVVSHGRLDIVCYQTTPQSTPNATHEGTAFHIYVLPRNFELAARFGKMLVRIPFWFLALLSATLAVVPWIRQITWRFSLRTLLIATTLVALLLGMVVWLRK